MSDRFRWLEFGDPSPPPAPGESSGPRRKDQHYHLDAAERAYLEGDYEPALRHYSAVLKYDPSSVPAWAGQVRSLVRLGEIEQALVWAEKALQKLADPPLVLSVAGLTAARAGDPSRGLQMSDAALEKAADEPLVWLERGAIVAGGGQWGTASTCFDKVRGLRGDDPDWTQRIGVEMFDAGDAARALKEFNHALDARPARPYLWLMSARAAARLKLYEKAAFAYDKVLELQSDHKVAKREKAALPSSWKSVFKKLLGS